jgi:hypothetical protein
MNVSYILDVSASPSEIKRQWYVCNKSTSEYRLNVVTYRTTVGHSNSNKACI